MRISEFYYLIKKHYPNDKLIISQTQLGQSYIIKNSFYLVQIIERCMKFGDLKRYESNINVLIENQKKNNRDDIKIDINSYQILSQIVAIINQFLPNLLIFTENFKLDSNQHDISFKLPDSVKTLEDANSILNEIQKIIKCISGDGNVKLKGFEHGTSWITLTSDIAGIFMALSSVIIGAFKLIKYIKKIRDKDSNENKHLRTFKICFECKNEDDKSKKITDEQLVETDIEREKGEEVDKIISSLPEEVVGRKKEELKKPIKDSIDKFIFLISEKGLDVKFSLSPPSFIKIDEQILIDFDEMKKISQQKKEVLKLDDDKNKDNEKK